MSNATDIEERVNAGFADLLQELRAKPIQTPPKPAPSIAELQAHYARHDLAFQPKRFQDAAE